MANIDVQQNIARLGTSLAALGTRRLIILGVVGALVMLAVGLSAWLLTRPQYETLYTNLSPRDVSAIGAALSEARIDFDVSADGQTVKVAYGQAARARMLLAEKGLPRSARAGYELFDNIGALGLTSFMQDVTLVRALEGELARTIQTINGVKAARVHLVLPRRYSFRRNSGKASASVLIRTDGSFSPASASAIRHLVAGAVPGLAVERVSVMDTDGTLLASGEDNLSAAPRRLVDLEQNLARMIRDNVRSTLVPYIGAGNFQVSVAARLNTDRRKVDEITYDPESKVERSVRDIKEKTSSVNSSSAKATSVQQEIPQEETGAGGGQKNQEKRDRKERITNYEISSRRVITEHDGYDIDRISLAVIVNRKALETVLGRKLTPEDLAAQEKELRALVASAAGLSEKRGDTLKITITDFIQSSRPLEPVGGTGFTVWLLSMLPTMLNAAAVIIAIALIMMLGVRPALRMLTQQAKPPAPEVEVHDQAGEMADQAALPGSEEGEAAAQLAAPAQAEGALPGPEQATAMAQEGAGDTAEAKAAEQEALDPLAELLDGANAREPVEKLKKLIEYDDRQAAAVLKEWLREEA